jgi:ectoine hydroxylase-related dioxygenase (phytanoyl-CoA dioxygenase family)
MELQSKICLPTSLDEPLAAESISQAAHKFRQHGCLLLENSFDPALVKTLQENFMRDYAAMDREAVEKTCLKVGADRYMFTIRLQSPFMDPAIYAAPRVLPVVRELLGKDCVLQSIGAVCAYPGAETQHVHRDHPDLFTEAAGLSAFVPPFALHVVVPLVDLDESTGTTALWEGSHRYKSQSEEQRWSAEELLRLEGAAMPWPRMGDCYFMDFRLRHAGTPNLSSLPRPILYLVYSRGWFQDRKNFDIQTPLLISWEEYDRIPEEYRQLFINAKPRD